MSEPLAPYFKGHFSFLGLENRRWITSSLAFISGVIVLVVYFQTRPSLETYISAEESFVRWESLGDEASYREMRKALRKVPSLEKKYAAVIAQRLFEKGALSDALLFAHHSLKSLDLDAPFHRTYGEISLLIEQGSYQDALQRSVSLKEEMKSLGDLSQVIGNYPVGGTFLFAHNLFRIACLHKELNNPPGERAAWDELEMFLTGKEGLREQIFESFERKEVTLEEYIAERKKKISLLSPK
jgi:hypothetical protein